MKYGVLTHWTSTNLGDDIQTYALAQFLPQIDYVMQREELDSFVSKDNEPVAVIMAAWWMWQKWNWPPPPCIIPKLTSMHITPFTVKQKASPIKDEWLDGVGGDFFRTHGPIGCRDQTTVEFLQKKGFSAYFSGCVTLTLPKQKVTADAGKYVCLVGLSEQAQAQARKYLKGTGLEIRLISHNCDYRKDQSTIEKRLALAEETLTQYQNAKLVITNRLHVSLPCLAMETPVIAIIDLTVLSNYSRWQPYSSWIKTISKEEFLSGSFAYNFANPPKNSSLYLETRENLIAEMKGFVEETKAKKAEEFPQVPYTQEEAKKWQFNIMHETLDKWLHQNRGILDDHSRQIAKLAEKHNKQINSINAEKTKELAKITRIHDKEIAALKHQIANPSIKSVIKVWFNNKLMRFKKKYLTRDIA